MNSSLRRKIELVRTRPELGALDEATLARVKNALLARLERQSAPEVSSGFFSMIRAPFYGLPFSMILKPVSVLAVVMISFTGWVWSMAASFNSIPGDTLYGLKLASERTQLSFATDNTTKASLRLEFAGRRAEEVARLIETGNSGHSIQVKEAVGVIKNEIRIVSRELAALKKSNAREAVPVAKIIERKVAPIAASIETSLTLVEDEDRPDVTEMREAVRVASVEALAVIAKADKEAASMEKKTDTMMTEVEIQTETLIKTAQGLEKNLSTRLPNLAILSAEDRQYVQELKNIRELLETASTALVAARRAFDEKDLQTANEKTQSALKTNEGVKIKLEVLETKLLSNQKKLQEKSTPNETAP